MENFLLYIGKSALAAGAFYLVYLALFQNQKQFTFNRIYLPVSLAVSFIIPLITFTTVNYVEPSPLEPNPIPVFTESFEPVVMQQSQPQFIWQWYHYLFAIYTAGTALFLFRLLLGHRRAWNIIRKSRVQELFNSLVNISKKDIHPFSFFSKIVLSENTLSNPHLEMIVKHEKIHVKEKHTLDILFTEILFLLQWFNPFAWLLKDAVKNNLEYKTDHEIAKITDAQTYQLAMVALADKQGVAPFLTALNGSQLKNRIVMMKKNTKNKYAWLKQLVALPLLAFLIMSLSDRKIKTEIKHQNENIAAHSEIQNETTVYNPTTNGNNEHLEDIIMSKKNKQIEPISDSKDNYKIQPDNEQETLNLSADLHITQEPDTSVSKKADQTFRLDNRLYIIDGKEYKDDINDVDVNDIESIDVLKDASATLFYGERGENGVVLIKTKSGNKSSLYPDTGQIEIKGKVISLHGQKPIPGASIFFTVNGVKSGTVSNTNGDFSILAENSDVFLEFLSEGYLKKEFAWDGSKELLVEMKPDKNSTMPGRTTEKTEWEKMLRKAGIERYPEGKEPIIIQDGYETLHNANDISGLYNPAIIKSITYKKSTNIDIRRKELAKNGFIEIKTTLPKQDKKLYIIDDEEVFLKNQKPSVYIYPKQLQKMRELSKDEAVKKYGKKAKHGAVEITTKSSALTEKNQELNKFLISIKFKQNQLILEGLEGCAFKELKFSINNNKPVAINQFGATSTKIDNSSNDSGFLFEIEKINDQIKLTGIKGTAWKELSYKPAIQEHFISETGVSPFNNNPLIVVDGMITGYKSIEHINPGDIQSVTVLKDEKAAEKYGVKGKDGAIEITMKPVRIYTELQLRKFIADEVRCPVLAHKSNLEKTVNLSVKIDMEGKISVLTGESLATDFTLDEIVVVGYKSKGTEATGYGSKNAAEEAQKIKEQLFADETKRVINKIPKLDIDKFKGKTVGITVKFTLQ